MCNARMLGDVGLWVNGAVWYGKGFRNRDKNRGHELCFASSLRV